MLDRHWSEGGGREGGGDREQGRLCLNRHQL